MLYFSKAFSVYPFLKPQIIKQSKTHFKYRYSYFGFFVFSGMQIGFNFHYAIQAVAHLHAGVPQTAPRE